MFIQGVNYVSKQTRIFKLTLAKVPGHATLRSWWVGW